MSKAIALGFMIKMRTNHVQNSEKLSNLLILCNQNIFKSLEIIEGWNWNKKNHDYYNCLKKSLNLDFLIKINFCPTLLYTIRKIIILELFSFRIISLKNQEFRINQSICKTKSWLLSIKPGTFRAQKQFSDTTITVSGKLLQKQQ